MKITLYSCRIYLSIYVTFKGLKILLEALSSLLKYEVVCVATENGLFQPLTVRDCMLELMAGRQQLKLTKPYSAPCVTLCKYISSILTLDFLYTTVF